MATTKEKHRAFLKEIQRCMKTDEEYDSIDGSEADSQTTDDLELQLEKAFNELFGLSDEDE